MKMILNINIEQEALNHLKGMADNNDMSVEVMCKYILEEFCHQGKVYSGNWREGPGRRILVDYPKYSSRVVKIKQDGLK